MKTPLAARSWRRGMLPLLSAALLLSLCACSLFDSSSDDDNEIVGRMAWGDASGGNSTIFAADLALSSSSSSNSVSTSTLAALAGNRGQTGATAAVVVKGREVPVSSVVFTRTLTARELAQGIGLTVTNVYQVSHGTTDYAPSIDATNWDRIYFHRRATDGSIAVWLADVKAGTDTRITNGTDPNASTANRLLYADHGIWSMNIATGEKRLIIPGNNFDPVPLTSGGRRLIFFNSTSDLTGQPYRSRSNFCFDEETGVITKLTDSTMMEDNPAPDAEGRLVVWHAWPSASAAAGVYYGRLAGTRVPDPVSISFRDEAGVPLTGNCWYVTWAGSDLITFTNGKDRLYVSDLQGNARSMGLAGTERDFTRR